MHVMHILIDAHKKIQKQLIHEDTVNLVFLCLQFVCEWIK